MTTYFFETYMDNGMDIKVGFTDADSAVEAKAKVNSFFKGEIISCVESKISDLCCEMWII